MQSQHSTRPQAELHGFDCQQANFDLADAEHYLSLRHPEFTSTAGLRSDEPIPTHVIPTELARASILSITRPLTKRRKRSAPGPTPRRSGGRKDGQKVAGKLSEAAAASCEWAANNGVVFDHGKTEAALFHKKRTVPTVKIEVGDKEIPFNKEATRWLGVWLGS
jgi:hypothetical protein